MTNYGIVEIVHAERDFVDFGAVVHYYIVRELPSQLDMYREVPREWKEIGFINFRRGLTRADLLTKISQILVGSGFEENDTLTVGLKSFDKGRFGSIEPVSLYHIIPPYRDTNIGCEILEKQIREFIAKQR